MYGFGLLHTDISHSLLVVIIKETLMCTLYSAQENEVF